MTATLHMIPPGIRRHLFRASDMPRPAPKPRPKRVVEGLTVRCIQTGEGVWFDRTYAAFLADDPRAMFGRRLYVLVDGKPKPVDAEHFRPVNPRHLRHYPSLARRTGRVARPIAVDPFGWEMPLDEAAERERRNH